MFWQFYILIVIIIQQTLFLISHPLCESFPSKFTSWIHVFGIIFWPTELIQGHLCNCGFGTIHWALVGSPVSRRRRQWGFSLPESLCCSGGSNWASRVLPLSMTDWWQTQACAVPQRLWNLEWKSSVMMKDGLAVCLLTLAFFLPASPCSLSRLRQYGINVLFRTLH